MRDSWRPNFGGGGQPPPMPDNVRDAMFSLNGVRQPANQPRSHDRSRRNGSRPYYQKPRPFRSMASRPLLSQKDGGDQQILRDISAADRFRNLDELTDSEEDEMSESDEEGRPLKKARKMEVEPSTTPSTAHKWSNPDPYTALPPAAEGTGKRTDVLKLIRKAKVASDKSKTEKDAQSEDFISFDFDDDDLVPNKSNDHRSATLAQGVTPQFGGPAGESLGKRKRDDADAMPRPPRGYLPPDQLMLPEWVAQSGKNPTPWFESRSGEDPAGIAIHKEIIDFYNWVKPQDYEGRVRADLLKRLSLAFNRLEPGELKAFGSYAAGLYLPIGDMDLVYFTRAFKPGLTGRGGLPPKPSNRLLHRFADMLRDHRIARQGTILRILHAKVPIIKFVDDRTGLKVDLSFDNDSGIIANETFQGWKVAYPTMPIIVAVIKQFLMVRGLNDVATGGLGGFSIICLVTSLLQHMPGIGPSANLGELLVEFFNLYGNLLDRTMVAIRLDPPGYIDKNSYKPMLFNEKKNRLTIIDPNRPENNISGGTNQIELIFRAFARAYDSLQKGLRAYEKGDTQVSFLEELIGGEFDAFETQRDHLGEVYFGLTGQEPPVQQWSNKAKTGIETDRQQVAANTAEASITTAVVVPAPARKLKKNERRAERLKEARPDIAQQIGDIISMNDALRIGGYENAEAMHIDIDATLSKKQKQLEKNKERNTTRRTRKK